MTTEDRIVVAMSELLRRQGYAASGIKQLAQASGAPVGSIYHHFPGGKAEIVARVLRTTGAAYIQLLPLLLDPYDDLVDGVAAFFETAAVEMETSDWMNMCPVGTITGEIADAEPALRAVAGEVIEGWIADGTAYFAARGLTTNDARSLAYSLISALEGAFVLARGLRSGEPLRAAGRAMASAVAALPVAVEAGSP